MSLPSRWTSVSVPMEIIALIRIHFLENLFPRLLYWSKGSTFYINNHLPDHVRHNGIRGAKNYGHINAVWQYIICIEEKPDHNWRFPSKFDGHISECLSDTRNNASSSYDVNEPKLELSKYSIYNGLNLTWWIGKPSGTHFPKNFELPISGS